MWRKNLMTVAEWKAFQTAFYEFFIDQGSPESIALFSESKAADDMHAILMTGPETERLETYWPGWRDSDGPQGENVQALVYNGDPWTRFGIRKRF